jgi:hypothetical protein
MQLVSPSVLAEACGFSVLACAICFAVGLLLWVFGWRGHRFWIVLITTIVAGVWGLYSARALGTQPILAGVLLAVAAGALALALVRVVAFAAAGLAAWILLRALAPNVDDPLVAVLVGGLIGLVLFRIWTMALTSFAGTLLMGYSGLCLTHHFGKLDAVAFSQQHTTLLNSACGGLALIGLVAQFLLERWRGNRSPQVSGNHSPKTYGGTHWWDFGQRTFRRAG